MSKCVVSVGYKNFVVDSDKGVQLLELLGDAEVYEDKWRSETKENTHHIYPNDDSGLVSLRLLPQGFYNMAKLAGKPNNS